MKDFYRQKGAGTRKLTVGQKNQVGYGKVIFLQGMAGVYQAVYLMLIRRFHFWQSRNSIYVKSQFGGTQRK